MEGKWWEHERCNDVSRDFREAFNVMNRMFEELSISRELGQAMLEHQKNTDPTLDRSRKEFLDACDETGERVEQALARWKELGVYLEKDEKLTN